MTGGKLSSAVRLLEEGGCGGVLDLDDDINGETVRDILKANTHLQQRLNRVLSSLEPP